MAKRDEQEALRQLVARVLSWEDAHASFDSAVEDFPDRLRGTQPPGLPYSAWQLVEHLRIAQYDILDFCLNADYSEMKWPDDYWPVSPAPPTPDSWNDSIRQYRRDREALQQLALNTDIDLHARIPHGSGQTYLRELLLVADHTTYHVGQLVLVRRLLGIWH
jgi:uncharacterized damage-inducible protein DinB